MFHLVCLWVFHTWWNTLFRPGLKKERVQASAPSWHPPGKRCCLSALNIMFPVVMSWITNHRSGRFPCFIFILRKKPRTSKCGHARDGDSTHCILRTLEIDRFKSQPKQENQMHRNFLRPTSCCVSFKIISLPLHLISTCETPHYIHIYY